MTKARYDERQPQVVKAGNYFQINLHETEVTEVQEMYEGTKEEHTCYEYDFNEFYSEDKTLEEVEDDPEMYLEYNPVTPEEVKKEDASKIAKIINDQAEQIKMLNECLLEVSEIVYA